MHVGTIFHTVTLRALPVVHQQAYRSTTRLGIIQDKPKQLKRQSKWHKPRHNEKEDDPRITHPSDTSKICPPQCHVAS
jgi:hypothetical protein